MTVTEQLWFIIGIAGFLVFFEAAIINILKGVWKALKRRWKDEYNDTARIIAGLVIFTIALVNLFSLSG